MTMVAVDATILGSLVASVNISVFQVLQKVLYYILGNPN